MSAGLGTDTRPGAPPDAVASSSEEATIGTVDGSVVGAAGDLSELAAAGNETAECG